MVNDLPVQPWSLRRRLLMAIVAASTVLWLCGPGAGSITGQAISVSGGDT